jgi:hypothetical protein
MPKNHARKNQLAVLKTELGIKHADAIALLDHPDAGERYALCEYLATYAGIDTYKDAVAYLEQERNEPANQVLCEKCGWTIGMICPECSGCGCNNHLCTGWRHKEYADDDDPAAEYDEVCEECGGNPSTPYSCECA